MAETLSRREDAQVDFTWDIASIFPSLADWEAEYAKADEAIAQLSAFQGKLTRSAKQLLNWMERYQAVEGKIKCIATYSELLSDQDTTNQANAIVLGRAQALITRYRAATSFVEPELLKLSDDKLNTFIEREPKLAGYRQYFHNLRRQQPHVRSPEVEELLAQASMPFGMAPQAYGMLSDADLKFGLASGGNGQPILVEQGNLDALLHQSDRSLRASAYNAYADGFLGVKNTMAAILAGKAKASAFLAKARRFDSVLSSSLFRSNISRQIYDTVIDACNRHLPVWHRYWDVRRRALKLDKMAPYDIFAPLAQPVRMTYAEAVETICEGMAPLGETYVEPMQRGCTVDRWVDVYPNVGKRSGAYSSGGASMRPFILMSFSESAGLSSMSTLAHELGHSMHTYLSAKHQPYVYSDYSLFVAEVASNFNQAMVRAHLMSKPLERNFEIGLIEEAMENFHRYLFLMPILSQFEQYVHGVIESGGALGADEMSQHLAGLFKRGYGPAVEMDEARDGITWAQFSHLYADFYVYQYASGIAVANALAANVRANGDEAAADYRRFLSAGSSVYALDALKIAGADLSSSEPMDRAFKVLEGFVDRLEQLIEQ